jgi:DNA-binding transcriptional LysR family regulator
MVSSPTISLEQWRALAAVVDEGGYAAAADSLHKSQSAVTYAVQQIEKLLGVKAFELQGRKAVLTATGRMLYTRARVLIDEAASLEQSAHRTSAGWEAEITIAVEIVFPTWLLLQCLDRFGREAPHTRIEIVETVIGGAPEALRERRVDLALTPFIPTGFSGTSLMRLGFVPVAHPEHPLFKLGRRPTFKDLRKHRHLVVRDTSVKRDKRGGFLESEQRWTVGHMATSLQAARMGFGFAWYPEEKIREELETRQLKVLPLQDGGDIFGEIYLVLADPEGAGPGVKRLADILKEHVAAACRRSFAKPAASGRARQPRQRSKPLVSASSSAVVGKKFGHDRRR